MMTPRCPRLLNMINDFVLFRFRARAPEDLSAIGVIIIIILLKLAWRRSTEIKCSKRRIPEQVTPKLKWWRLKEDNLNIQFREKMLSERRLLKTVFYPSYPGGFPGGGGWGSKFQKSSKFHELSRKSIKKFPPPTKGGRSGNFRGSKNQKSGKCHELPRKVLTTN